MPSILVELGYISNAEDAKYLGSESGQKRMSRCISEAFDKYYTDLMKLNASQPAVESTRSTTIPASKELPKAIQGDEQQPVFKVQFLSSSKQLAAEDKAFKGLKPVEFYYDKGLYKYTYGSSTNYNDIIRIKKKVNEKFKDAFIVAFVQGERIDTQQAIALFKQNNP